MITFNERTQVFALENENIGYYMGIADGKYLGHIHYGKKINSSDELSVFLRTEEHPFVPSKNARDELAFNESFYWEFPCGGRGDFRESCIEILNEKNQSALDLQYDSYRIINGKPVLEGLPATYGTESDCETLEIVLKDKLLDVKVYLYYSIFKNISAVARSARIENKGSKSLKLKKALSFCLNLDNDDYEFISLHGGWARERKIERTPLLHGRIKVSSLRGVTSSQENNFIAVAEKQSDYEKGNCYGLSLIYSGNFLSQAEVSQFENVRVVTGINPEGFLWCLKPGESFTVPEAVCVYSDCGLGKMSRNFHDLWRNHLIRSKYCKMNRPVLINNWEATYFNFDTEKLVSLTKKASVCGIEMLVMDDGWFGLRNDDSTSLGDWYVNEEKIKGGLKNLVDRINALGVKFGIWIEPEMISRNSQLYREHKDWAIAVEDRTGVLSRAQYVLDITRKEVRDYILEKIFSVLHSANIAYVKWDMNRLLSDAGSIEYSGVKQGEIFHRYVLALYEMQERLLKEFPDLLLENCSSGGFRFDPGMLYFSPQIWTSDDCDPVERLSIHEGTALCYPVSSMGAHVAASPNHSVGRETPFMTRAFTAMHGTFGYELDIEKLPSSETDLIPEQIKLYKQKSSLVREGDYYRIASYLENKIFDIWEIASKDKSTAFAVYTQVLNEPNFHSRIIRFHGFDFERKYSIKALDSDLKKYDMGILSGSTIENCGIKLPRLWGDFKSMIIEFCALNS